MFKKIFFYFVFKYHNKRLQISFAREIHQNLPPLADGSFRIHLPKQGKIIDFWRFWQKSRLSEVRFPSRVAENQWRMSFGMFIVGTLVTKNPGNIRTKFRGSKSLQILVKIEFSTKSAQSEASLTKEIQWWQIENFKIVNFESHDRFFLQKWSLVT